MSASAARSGDSRVTPSTLPRPSVHRHLYDDLITTSGGKPADAPRGVEGGWTRAPAEMPRCSAETPLKTLYRAEERFAGAAGCGVWGARGVGIGLSPTVFVTVSRTVIKCFVSE